MNKYRLAGIAVAAVVTTPISAYALNFDFSFKGGSGNTVSGEIFGLATSGQSHATDIVIDTLFPHASITLPLDFFAKATLILGNTLTVSNGQIFGADFFGLGPSSIVFNLKYTANSNMNLYGSHAATTHGTVRGHPYTLASTSTAVRACLHRPPRRRTRRTERFPPPPQTPLTPRQFRRTGATRSARRREA